MIFKVGDKVKIIDEAADGFVAGINKGLITIDVNGFAIEYMPEQLMKVDGNKVEVATKKIKIHKQIEPKTIPQNKTVTQARLKSVDKRTFSIDLHIDELIDYHRSMLAGEKLNIQLETFRDAIYYCRTARIKRLIVIHGVGSGKLRREVRNAALDFEDLQIEDAPMRHFGDGATLLLFR